MSLPPSSLPRPKAALARSAPLFPFPAQPTRSLDILPSSTFAGSTAPFPMTAVPAPPRFPEGFPPARSTLIGPPIYFPQAPPPLSFPPCAAFSQTLAPPRAAALERRPAPCAAAAHRRPEASPPTLFPGRHRRFRVTAPSLSTPFPLSSPPPSAASRTGFGRTLAARLGRRGRTRDSPPLPPAQQPLGPLTLLLAKVYFASLLLLGHRPDWRRPSREVHFTSLVHFLVGPSAHYLFPRKSSSPPRPLPMSKLPPLAHFHFPFCTSLVYLPLNPIFPLSPAKSFSPPFSLRFADARVADAWAPFCLIRSTPRPRGRPLLRRVGVHVGATFCRPSAVAATSVPRGASAPVRAWTWSTVDQPPLDPLTRGTHRSGADSL